MVQSVADEADVGILTGSYPKVRIFPRNIGNNCRVDHFRYRSRVAYDW